MHLQQTASAQEFRAAWADIFHVGMGSQAQVDAMVTTLKNANYNAVVVQVLGYMDNTPASHGAHWKSNIVPWSSRVTASFDPLAYLCTKAHQNGIEVHAWIGGSGGAMYRVSTSWPPAGNALLASHPEWFMAPLANSEGGAPVPVDGFYILDMGSSDAQEYMVSIVRELVTNYPIDGINWDDEINGTGYNQGYGYPAYSQAAYPRSGLARFRINTGRTDTPSNTDTAWANYRRRFKNELMARVQAEIQSIKSNPRQPLRHTTAALAYSPVPSTCSFTGSAPYLYFCDWAGMLQNGWVDAAIPQTYSSSTFNSWADRIASCWQYQRHVYPGIGAYLNSDTSIANMIAYTRSKGLKGNAIYSYAVPNNSANPTTWWSYAAANVYTNVVSTPPMPWRNPATATEGILWGRVKSAATGLYLDDATVTVTGSGRPAVKTDGNGYYVATLVPATAAGRSYSVTASKTTFGPLTTNAVVLAGDVVRLDISLPADGPAAPTGLTATAVSTTRINLSWTDNANNETGFVVGRSSSSGGPYTDIATLTSNTISYASIGLSPETTYYYVVRATNAQGISANTPQASATTFGTSPPLISGQPQSKVVKVGSGISFGVVASGPAPLSYQWRLNGAPIPGATGNIFSIGAAQYSDAGAYSVVVSNPNGTDVSASAQLSVLNDTATITLSNIWNIRAGSRDYVTSGNTERGLCINPFTGHVLLVSRSPQIPNSLGAFILDVNTGNLLGNMDVSTVGGSATFLLNKIDVADDGVIYGANLTTSSGSSPFVIYRWASESAVPTVAYSGAPDNGATARWGDSFSVSGSGVNTRILVSGSGTANFILFSTANGTSFTPTIINSVSPAVTAEFARGLFAVGGNRFYNKNRASATGQLFSYNPAANNATPIVDITPLEANMLSIAVATNLNLLAGVIDNNTANNSDHALKVYEITNPSSPLVVSNYTFLPIANGTNSGNANFAASVDTDGKHIVALDTQNGIIALEIVTSRPTPSIESLELAGTLRHFGLSFDPGSFVLQSSSDFSNWVDLAVTRTNGMFQATEGVTNALKQLYRTKLQ